MLISIKRFLSIIGLAFTVAILVWLVIPSTSSNITIHALKESPAWMVKALGYNPKSSAFKDVCRKQGISLPPRRVHIIIDKSDYKLSIYSGTKLIKSYPVSFGKNPVDDKIREGDGRTPEGLSFICEKSGKPRKLFLGTRWMRLSYPNKEDALRGLKAGLIDSRTADEIIDAANKGKMPPQTTALGGAIGIHGGGFDRFGSMMRTWTAGCVALYDKDIEEFYDYIPLRTEVLIQK